MATKWGDIKNFLHAWVGKKRGKLGKPVYTSSEERPMRANGTRSNQPALFRAQLNIHGVDYEATGEAKAIKLAQTEAARDMTRYLIQIGQISPNDVVGIPNAPLVSTEQASSSANNKANNNTKFFSGHVVTSRPVEDPVEKLRNSYRLGWKSGEVIQQRPEGTKILSSTSNPAQKTSLPPIQAVTDIGMPSVAVQNGTPPRGAKRQRSPEIQPKADSQPTELVFFGRKRVKSDWTKDVHDKEDGATSWEKPPTPLPSSSKRDLHTAGISGSDAVAYLNRSLALLEGKTEDSKDTSSEVKAEQLKQSPTSTQKEVGLRPGKTDSRSSSDESAETRSLVDLTSDVDEPSLPSSSTISSDAAGEKSTRSSTDLPEILSITKGNAFADWSKPGTSLTTPPPTPGGKGPTEVAQNFMKMLASSKRTELEKLSADILAHYKTNGQDRQVYDWKMDIRRRLQTEIQSGFQECYLFATGSTINGCGSYNSDMDLCLVVPDYYLGTETDRNYGIDVLKRVRNILYRRFRPFASNIELIPAKVPILRFDIAMGGNTEELQIDMNCNNVAGIFNSHLAHYYSEVDERFPALCLLVKHWAIKANINDAQAGTFNSYSLILLVLHFLQIVSVLPNLQELFPDIFSGNGDVRNLQLHEQLPPIPSSHISNKQSLGELLVGFFAYYNHFDFRRDAISIRRSCRFPRREAFADTNRFQLYIEEPFDLGNTARCVYMQHKMNSIRVAFREAYNAVKENPCVAALRVTV